ncbi:MAG TPA: hypothetical protein VN496_02375 [Burkholderiales bacterium]|nr:hypothetical protein [Burkholderiales bacterium]
MLTRLIVNLYAWIMEIYLWLVLLISGVAGYHYTIPLLKDVGAIPESEAVWKIYGALAFAVAALLLSAVATGPFLVLVEIRKSIRALETKKSSDGSSELLPAERREPLF